MAKVDLFSGELQQVVFTVDAGLRVRGGVCSDGIKRLKKVELSTDNELCCFSLHNPIKLN